MDSGSLEAMYFGLGFLELHGSCNLLSMLL